MHFHPQKSGQAHSQIGKARLVVASSLPPAPDIQSGPRDSYPAAGRGVAAGQRISIAASVREALRGGERGAQAAGAFFAIFLIFALAVLA